MKKNILIIYLLLCYSIASAQYNDMILTYSGDSIKCNIINIKEGTVYFQRSGPDGNIAIQEIKNLFIDNQLPRKVSQAALIENYNESKHRLDSIAGNNAISPPAQLTAIKIPSRRGDSAGYYTHTLKLNPLSAILLDLTIKYGHRFNIKYGLQTELGYIHGFEGFQGLAADDFTKEVPFAYKGIVTKAAFIRYFEPVRYNRNRYLSAGLFYKYQYHGKRDIDNSGYSYDHGKIATATRAVYGAQFTLGNQKYLGHFLFEWYAGISLRYIHEKQVIYYGSYLDGPNLVYGDFSPPHHATRNYVRPAIQLGFNLGWGFNSKKKK